MSREPISDEELAQWAKFRADDAGHLARELILYRKAGNPPPQAHVLVDVEAEIARVVQSVNEWDDRTSPDDYPEHLLITSEELAEILRNFAETLEGKDNG